MESPETQGCAYDGFKARRNPIIMTPSANELAAGQKAYERMEAFQRYRSPGDLLSFLVIIIGFSVWNAFERGGWQQAFWTGMVWAAISAVSIYQFRAKKRQAGEDSVFLATLKARYGATVYADIQKLPHSLAYYVFQKRFPPFNRKAVKLP